jgi:ATP-dependent Clp protease ATP-binding subunit ClpA
MRTLNNGFSSEAQEALRLAHEIVQQKRHSQLDVEHILLALLKPRDGVVYKMIEILGGDPRQLQRQLDDALNAGPRSYTDAGGAGTTNIHISMRAQRVVSEAANEASKLDDEYIGAEHLFLAIAGERGDNVAGRQLRAMAIDQERIYPVLSAQRGFSPEFTVQPWDDADPHSRLLARVIRLQNELDGLRREVEALIKNNRTA